MSKISKALKVAKGIIGVETRRVATAANAAEQMVAIVVLGLAVVLAPLVVAVETFRR